MKTKSTCILILALLATFIPIAVAAPPEPAKILEEWQPPSAKLLGSGMGGTISYTYYSTAKHLDEVWAHYAKKLGLEAEGKPSLSGSKTTRTPAGETIQSFVFSAKEHDGTIRAITLIYRARGQSITIHLSPGPVDRETLVSVLAEPR